MCSSRHAYTTVTTPQDIISARLVSQVLGPVCQLTLVLNKAHQSWILSNMAVRYDVSLRSTSNCLIASSSDRSSMNFSCT